MKKVMLSLIVIPLLLELFGLIGLMDKTESKLVNTSPRVPHPELGYWHPKDERYLASKSCIDDTCFKDIEYRFDHYGRRTNEKTPSQKKEVPIILLGDSFVFGVGLPFEQTLGARLSKLFKRPVLNYGINDADPHLSLRLLKKRVLQKQVPPHSDLLLIINGPLIAKLLPSLKEVHRKERPVYFLNEEGEWSYSSSALEVYRDQFYWFEILNFIKKHSFFFTWLDLDFSFYSEEERTQQLVHHYAEIARLYRQFFHGRLFLIEHPHAGITDIQLKALKEKGLPAIAMELPSDFEGPRDLCECDSNPSGAVNKVFSEMIYDKLRDLASPSSRSLE